MDDETKQKVLIAFVAFNVTVLFYQLMFNSSPFVFTKLILGFVLGAVVGGAAFGVVHFLQSRA